MIGGDLSGIGSRHVVGGGPHGGSNQDALRYTRTSLADVAGAATRPRRRQATRPERWPARERLGAGSGRLGSRPRTLHPRPRRWGTRNRPRPRTLGGG